MEIILYDNLLRFLCRFPQDHSPKLSELKVRNVVPCFDQSTKCTGITFGDSKGNIHGYARLIKENRNENGRIFIANYHRWLEHFIDVSPDYLMYEHTFSKGYFNTDVILSQLRGTFPTLKKNLGWDFPIDSVMQQEWKANLIQLKPGDHSLTKENVQQCVADYIVPGIIEDDDYEDVYDSIGIYHYYRCNIMNRSTDTPLDVSKKLKIKDTTDYVIDYCVGAEPDLYKYSRVSQNRGIRYFNYTRNMSPREHIARLASNSNDFWICHVPLVDNPFIDQILPSCGRLPTKDEKVFLMGYRVKKGNFPRIIL